MRSVGNILAVSVDQRRPTSQWRGEHYQSERR